MFTRREFLGRGTAGVSALALGGTMGGLLARAAEVAAENEQSDRILVVVELAGGNDGLNTLVPFENDLYYGNRPSLAIPKGDVIRLNDQLGLHPAMKPLGELFRRGKMAIVQGVGYPQPDRSHFRSMEIWHTAGVGRVAKTTGWLGRFLDAQSPAASNQALAGVAMTDALPQALLAEHFAAPVLSSLEGADEESLVSERTLRELSKPRGN
ncbi:MAG TPA: hypothetical protein VHY20_09970, partial [Pirellulales bacterium]|nr:hypothetical protein [Pirellulales bacterium]